MAIEELKRQLIECNTFTAMVMAQIQRIRDQLIFCIGEKEDLEAESLLGTAEIDDAAELRLVHLDERIARLRYSYVIEHKNLVTTWRPWYLVHDELERLLKSAPLGAAAAPV